MSSALLGEQKQEQVFRKHTCVPQARGQTSLLSKQFISLLALSNDLFRLGCERELTKAALRINSTAISLSLNTLPTGELYGNS